MQISASQKLDIPLDWQAKKDYNRFWLKKSAINKLAGKLQKIKIDPTEANTWLADLGTSAIDEKSIAYHSAQKTSSEH